MSFTIEPTYWLKHGGGKATFVSPHGEYLTIHNFNNINKITIKPTGGGEVVVPLDEFVDALNQIGFTVSALVEHWGETKSLGAGADPFAAAWETAQPVAPKRGDQVITRTGVSGNYSYGTFVALVDLAGGDDRVRVLKAAEPEPEILPDWLEASVIKGSLDGADVVIAERDCDDDWLVYGLDSQPLAGEYIYSYEEPEKRFTDVEVLVP